MSSYHEAKGEIADESPIPLDAPFVDRPGVSLENEDAAALRKALPFSPDRSLPVPTATFQHSNPATAPSKVRKKSTGRKAGVRAA